MKITNKNNGAILAPKAALALTPWMRMKGLLGKHKSDFPQGAALIIKPCSSIHSLFMGFPIDVLFVSPQNQVIKIISCLRPFRFTAVYFNTGFVIELPAGTIQSTNTQAGDYLSLD
jgi:uncharacterized membrane protein (UPF0127 family)